MDNNKKIKYLVKHAALLFMYSALCVYVTNIFFNHSLNSSRSASAGQFEYIKALLNAYHDEHGRFPPTSFQRNPGEPFHSWRVLLLKYSSENWIDSYTRYEFSKEWNDPVNVEALGKVSPNFFRMYLRKSTKSFFTQYISIGENDDWPNYARYNTFIVKRGNNIFILIEKEDSNVNWASPLF